MIFTANDLKARFRPQPFTPVRIVTTTGETYDVYHPDLVLIGTRYIEVGMPSAEDAQIFEQITRIPLIHITELQDLPGSKPSSSGNGPPAK